tara:strand:+ start:246 stop:776 length:531 start_codon:yes stop_codon:yes gene_type:complete
MASIKFNNVEVFDSNGKVTASGMPTGSVLQVVHFEETEGNTLTTSWVNYYEKSFTLKSSSSDVYINHVWQYRAEGNSGHGLRIYRNSSATVTTSHTAVWTKNVENTGTDPWSIYTANDTINGIASIVAKDTVTGFSAGDTIHYGFFYRKAGTPAVYVPYDYDLDGFFATHFYEVAK